MIPLTEIIDWQGITLSVTYTPQGRLPVNHLAIKVVAPVGGTLPITETGYRSYFFYDDIAPLGGPIAYVRAWLDEAAQSPEWQERQQATQQLALF